MKHRLVMVNEAGVTPPTVGGGNTSRSKAVKKKKETGGCKQGRLKNIVKKSTCFMKKLVRSRHQTLLTLSDSF